MGVGDLVPDAGAAFDVELAAGGIPGIAPDDAVGAVELLDDLARQSAVDELGGVAAVNDLYPALRGRLLIRSHDSQEDSQAGERQRLNADAGARGSVGFELVRASADGCGRDPRGLQNRLRGADDASWVGSIPIHPRHFPCGKPANDSQGDSHSPPAGIGLLLGW